MPSFDYKTIDKEGRSATGTIDAVNHEVAISSLQKRGLTVVSIEEVDENGQGSFFGKDLKIFERVSNKDVVILSRQIATLFEAQVSALRVFKLLAEETPNTLLRDTLVAIADDIQGGSSISDALSRHPKIFSSFYVNMVKSGEESGTLDQTFGYLADYLDRTYAVTTKARNALVYPAFVILTFIGVMILMMTTVIPRITQIIVDSGQEIPIYTKIVIWTSDFTVHFGWLVAIVVAIGGVALWRYVQKTDDGKLAWSQFRLGVPYLGNLYQKLFLSRISDNMNTMISTGIPMVQALEVTAAVVDDRTYQDILLDALDSVRGGSTVSKALGEHPEIPGILTQMVKVGEETGELGKVLNTMANFYRREVENAVDTLVGLIEPAMIVLLGAGVGILLAAVLLPIYSISTGF